METCLLKTGCVGAFGLSKIIQNSFRSDIGLKRSHLRINTMGYLQHKCTKGVHLRIITYMSSLQCYSVLSTIAQVLRKMILKILVSRFLMPHLSQTFESYQRVKIYT